MTISAQAGLLRGFAIDFLTAHDAEAARRIMDPTYRLSIGGHLLAGRDDVYLPATVAQLDLFPGLTVTAHDTVFGEDMMALRFTEHGVSTREKSASSWGGITLFRLDGGRIVHGWAEEDYFARKRQLKSGQVDAIAPPHPAPWDEPVRGSDTATESVLRDWLDALDFSGVEEIAAEGPQLAELIRPRSLIVSALFTAGRRAAFHAVLTGEYLGGFLGVGTVGATASLNVAAIVDVREGRVARVQLCADRLGFQRSIGAR